MSGEALGWAIVQKAGSPSGKAVLIALANYADKRWCSSAPQSAIAEFGEHSVDSVQKRLPDLERRGLIRCIPLFFAGRRSVHFVILAPSDLFKAPLSALEPFFPRGCTVDPSYDAADCGSMAAETNAATPESEISALPQNAASIPQPAATLPQSAADVAAVCPPRCRNLRQEDSRESDDDDSRGANVSRDAGSIAKEVMEIAGRSWAGTAPAEVIQSFLTSGYTREHILAGTRACMANKRGGPPHSIKYFFQSWADARERAETPTEIPKPQPRTNGSRHVRRNETSDVIDALDQFAGSQPDEPARGGGTRQPSIERIPVPKLG